LAGFRGSSFPPGRYVVESLEEEPPVLTPEEEAGIEAALESYRSGPHHRRQTRPRDHRHRQPALKTVASPQTLSR
jgi:hypothetical protein